MPKRRNYSLVDNSVDILLPNTKVAFHPSLNENWFVHPLLAEYGLCAVVKLVVNGTKHRQLFDSDLDPLAAHVVSFLHGTPSISV